MALAAEERSDETLVEAAKQGEVRALEALLDRHQAMVLSGEGGVRGQRQAGAQRGDAQTVDQRGLQPQVGAVDEARQAGAGAVGGQ